MDWFSRLFAPAFLIAFVSAVPAQDTLRVNLGPGGVQADDVSSLASISADGRYLAFTSRASNLVPGDTNGELDIFVRDLQTGAVERVSVTSAGAEANGLSKAPSISADGRFVAFKSDASNLYALDTNGYRDVFIHDRFTGQTRVISVSHLGGPADGPSQEIVLSTDGRFAAFTSEASNLVGGDTNGVNDVFFHDRLARRTYRISLKSNGLQGNDASDEPFISADGRYVSFRSLAGNLVPGDTNANWDIFVRDVLAGTTERVSVSSSGNQGFRQCRFSALSADGRFVAFDSLSINLIPNDTNGSSDVFLHDRLTGTTERVSVKSNSSQGNRGSFGGNSTFLSPDGNVVAFTSYATNLVTGDLNGKRDVFVHDRRTGVTERVSVSGSGQEGNGSAWRWLSFSSDHRYLTFTSDSDNLVAGDTNGEDDIFIRDRGAGAVSTTGTILLGGPLTAQVGESILLNWCAAPPYSDYWVMASYSISGSIVVGHFFDLGQPRLVLMSGVHSADGAGSFTTALVAASSLGRVIYFEIVARDAAGQYYDSNPATVLVE